MSSRHPGRGVFKDQGVIVVILSLFRHRRHDLAKYRVSGFPACDAVYGFAFLGRVYEEDPVVFDTDCGYELDVLPKQSWSVPTAA